MADAASGRCCVPGSVSLLMPCRTWFQIAWASSANAAATRKPGMRFLEPVLSLSICGFGSVEPVANMDFGQAELWSVIDHAVILENSWVSADHEPSLTQTHSSAVIRPVWIALMNA